MQTPGSARLPAWVTGQCPDPRRKGRYGYCFLINSLARARVRARARARALSLGPSTVTVSVEAVGRGDQSSSTRENLNGPVTVTVDRPVMVDYGLGLPRTKQGVYSHRYNREIQIQF